MKTEPLLVASACIGCLAPLSAVAQPVITVQPANQFLGPTATAYLLASANGAAPITYQWLFNGTPIVGATNRTLSVPSPQPAQSGYYSLIPSNSSSPVT